jgi:hypothetical protein
LPGSCCNLLVPSAATAIAASTERVFKKTKKKAFKSLTAEPHWIEMFDIVNRLVLHIP